MVPSFGLRKWSTVSIMQLESFIFKAVMFQSHSVWQRQLGSSSSRQWFFKAKLSQWGGQNHFGAIFLLASIRKQLDVVYLNAIEMPRIGFRSLLLTLLLSIVSFHAVEASLAFSPDAARPDKIGMRSLLTTLSLWNGLVLAICPFTAELKGSAGSLCFQLTFKFGTACRLSIAAWTDRFAWKVSALNLVAVKVSLLFRIEGKSIRL